MSDEHASASQNAEPARTEGGTSTSTSGGTSTPTSPRGAGWRANLAVVALIPLGALAGGLAHPDHEGPRDPVEAFFIVGMFGGFVALLATPFVRLAHRFATEWLALLLGGGAWVVSSLVADFSRPRLGSFASRSDYHRACVRDGLTIGNLGASSAALLLGGIAVVLALLLESRRDPAQRPLSRTALALSLVPVALTALVAAHGAEMWGFALTAISLAYVAVLRVATRVCLTEPRSLALGIASVLGAGLAIAAATSGATTHALALAMDVLRNTRVSDHLGAALARIDATSLVSGAPVLALLPALGLAFALEGRARAALPRRAIVLSAGVIALLLWLDARNLVDLRTHVQTYALAIGARELAVPAGDLRLPTIGDGVGPEQSFVVLSPRGGAWYRGRPLSRGLRDLRGLTRRGRSPALAMDARTPISDVAAAARALGGQQATTFVGLGADRTRLVQIPVGRWVSIVGAPSDRILLYLQLADWGCAIASTAGERIDIPDCDRETLRVRLQERRAAEPNRADILLAPEAAITLQQLIDVARILDETGYVDRGVVDARSF